ncbi:MAG: hypothetical protein ACREMQ_15245, partial [Longimicrobiales bacterium]
MDDRRLTLIIVPHGDLETRTFEIPYRRLKFGIIMAGTLLLLFGFIVASWFPVAAQAGRVPGLERELVRLEGERAKVAELAQMLAEVEAQYERVRELLGAEGQDQTDPVLPPLKRDSSASGVNNQTEVPAGAPPGTRESTIAGARNRDRAIHPSTYPRQP